jgi:beta-glucosidase-like glycosyl hydrolase
MNRALSAQSGSTKAPLPFIDKIGQLMIYINHYSEEPDAYDRAFIREFRPGGLIYRARGRAYHYHRERTAAYLAGLQGIAEAEGLPGPLIVCVDHRGGGHTALSPEVGGLEFPAPIAMGALAEDAEVAADEIGRAAARDVLDVGFNLNLAPYGDFMEVPEVERFVFGNAMMEKTSRRMR